MTIQVEREALISVLSRSPSWSSLPCEALSIPSDDDEFVVVDFQGKRPLDVDFVPCSTYSDEDSLCTSSTSSESLSTEASIERRVSFATSLVTDEWTRPYTPRGEVSKLFYSNEEMNRFRQDYRLERKVLNELSIDPDTLASEEEDLSNIFSTSNGGRHSISRVVVLHNNKLETFLNPCADVVQRDIGCDDFFDNDNFWSGSLTWY